MVSLEGRVCMILIFSMHVPDLCLTDSRTAASEQRRFDMETVMRIQGVRTSVLRRLHILTQTASLRQA